MMMPKLAGLCLQQSELNATIADGKMLPQVDSKIQKKKKSFI
jgi:hypothetical protein